MFDDDPPRQAAPHEIGMRLDPLSVEELEERIVLLEEEIARLRSAIEARGKTRSAAESVFKS